MSNDYEIGYGKPPKQTRFKKGQSGNPNGRPKGRQNNGSIVRKIVDRKVTVRDNGRERKITVFEALVEKLVAKALNGSVNDQIKLVQLIEKHVPDKLADVPKNTDRDITIKFIDSDGNGRPANREDYLDWQLESHRQEVEKRNRDPKVVAAWKAAGFGDDDDDEAPTA